MKTGPDSSTAAPAGQTRSPAGQTRSPTGQTRNNSGQSRTGSGHTRASTARVNAAHASAALATRTDVEGFLRGSGLRRTPVRVGVVEVLAKAGRPMSVPQILGKLRGVDSVTVYRTLNTFVAKGLAHRVRSEDRSWLYAMGPAQHAHEHKHPHFVCESCGKVQCLESSTIPDDFIRQLGVNNDYTITYSEVVLHGACPACK